ncbi:Phosphate import ATP-binding protein PstB 3 [Microbacterium sp. Bi128]|nr:Phosphate import ATP-binding protein PstB 3 [Microbacterium sp. Bi128]
MTPPDDQPTADDITEVHASLAAASPRERRPRRFFAASPSHAPAELAEADSAQLTAARVPLADDTVTEVVTASARAASAAPLRVPAEETVRDAADEIAAAHAESHPPRELSTLDAQRVSAWFGTHKVLERVSLTMPAGQVTALIGPSGCGKSTFLRILNRMHELVPSASLAGEVLLDGDDIYERQKKLQDARKDIGMVFQKPNPFPAMSIYDNVVAGLKLTGRRASRDEKDAIVERSLTSAGLWKEVKDRLRAPGGGLSGGQQQRLCIARSLAVTPKVLLMDEPCSALDPTSTRVIEETMSELQKEVTIVIVTHNMQQAQRVSQQCAFFLASQGQPGHIVEHGDTEAMFSEPQDPRTYDYVNGRFG